MPLAQIEAVVNADGDEATAAIDAYEMSLNDRVAARKFLLLRARRHYGRNSMASEVTTALVPDRPVLSVLRRCHVDVIDRVIGGSVAELRAAADGLGLSLEGDPFGIFHNPIDMDRDGPLEIGIPVSDLAATEGDIRSYRLPGGRLANRVVVGEQTDFPAILGFYDGVCSWIDESGHSRVGPPRETWHNTPGSPEPLKLTISWPYA